MNPTIKKRIAQAILFLFLIAFSYFTVLDMAKKFGWFCVGITGVLILVGFVLFAIPTAILLPRYRKACIKERTERVRHDLRKPNLYLPWHPQFIKDFVEGEINIGSQVSLDGQELIFDGVLYDEKIGSDFFMFHAKDNKLINYDIVDLLESSGCEYARC